jgi:hypothetical protein
MFAAGTYRQLVLLCLLGIAGACADGGGAAADGGGGGSADARLADAAGGPDAVPGVEVCDGRDNDMDQFVDEGAAEDLCGVIANGIPKCNGLGGCAIESCGAGFVDVDGLFSTGCECGQEAGEAGSLVCEEGIDLGDLPDSNSELQITGTLAPAADVDYYRFRAVDTPDSTCDTFHARVLFLENPGAQYAFSLWRGGCAGTQLCDGSLDAQWYTNFASGMTGQCPCGGAGSPTVNECQDDGAEFVVMVKRLDGLPVTCDAYKLEISNGKYSAP